MSNQEGKPKSASIEPIRLMKKQESFEVFPIHERVSSNLTEDEVIDLCNEMGMEAVVINGLIPYRDAITTLEKRYLEEKSKFTQLGFDLAMEPFIPQYIGFEEVPNSEVVTYYKDGVILRSTDAGWMVFNGNGQPVLNQIDNMLEGIHVVKFFGANVSIDEYLEKF